MFENIGLRFALIVLGTFNQGWLMKGDWKLKLVETLPYLILAITLMASVIYDKAKTKNFDRHNSGQIKQVTLKSDVNFEQDRWSKK